MANTRIKDLTKTNYDSSYKIAVDDQTNGTKSISLSQIPNTTYTFAGSNGYLNITPSDTQTSQTIDIAAAAVKQHGTPSSGDIAVFQTSGYLQSGAQIDGSSTENKFLKINGSWDTPSCKPTYTKLWSGSITEPTTLTLHDSYTNYDQFVFVVSIGSSNIKGTHLIDKCTINVDSSFFYFRGTSESGYGYFSGEKKFTVSQASDLDLIKIIGIKL